MEQKKILIVDDETAALDIVEKKLRENNYYVTAVTKGKEALEMAKSDKPDLILLDIALPDIDGYEVAAVLRKDRTLKAAPIIFLTGKDLEYSGVERRLSAIGAYDFLSKPFSFAELLAKIKKIIG